jgi:photoactive yellow protein
MFEMDLELPTLSEVKLPTFDDTSLLAFLSKASGAELDMLDFGVIGFNSKGLVTRYNALEAQLAGLTAQRVVGNPLFTVVAPCMNNHMVSQRFMDAGETRVPMDTVIDYVLTLRMKPVKVKMRLIYDPTGTTHYVLVNRI